MSFKLNKYCYVHPGLLKLQFAHCMMIIMELILQHISFQARTPLDSKTYFEHSVII